MSHQYTPNTFQMQDSPIPGHMPIMLFELQCSLCYYDMHSIPGTS